MTTYPKLKNENPTLSKLSTKDNELKEPQYRTEKHDQENILKSLKIDNEYYRKKNKNLNKKKVIVIITEILIGSPSTINSSTVGLINPGASIIISKSTAFLTSFAISITNEHFSKLKLRYTKLRDCINVITLLNEKTMKESMIDEKIDQKEAEQLKQIYNHYLDKRKEIWKTHNSK